MAEIPIQPKRSKSILPWAIGAIVLLLLLWYLLSGRADRDDVPGGADTTKTSWIESAQQYAAAGDATTGKLEDLRWQTT